MPRKITCSVNLQSRWIFPPGFHYKWNIVGVRGITFYGKICMCKITQKVTRNFEHLCGLPKYIMCDIIFVSGGLWCLDKLTTTS